MLRASPVIPASTLVTVPVNWSLDVTVNVLPLLVTKVVPEPTINTSSFVASEPASLTPAVPFVDPTPSRSYVVFKSVPSIESSLSLILVTVMLVPPVNVTGSDEASLPNNVISVVAIGTVKL